MFHIFPSSFKEAGLEADAPEEGEEYLFNCRPSTQRTITQYYLNQWYVNLFNEAKDQGVVDDITYDGKPKPDLSNSVSFFVEVLFEVVI